MDREEQNRLILAELARLYPDARPALHFILVNSDEEMNEKLLEMYK